MTTPAFMTDLTRSFNRAGLQLKKHSPEILVIGGVIGLVTSAVMACKATTKAQVILEEAKTQVDAVHEVVADETISKEKYSEEDSKKDLAIIYVQTGIKFAKLYGPSIILGALSITSILASNNILRKRNVALAAAYTAVDTGFKEYRGRVVERFGKELDKELRYNIKAQEIEETVVNENGEETTVKKVVNVSTNPIDLYSSYARCWDKHCKGWHEDHELRLLFLRQTQNYANDLLKLRGHVFLNDVYDMLGFQRSKAGQLVGWVYDEKNPVGDNFIDFGIYDIYKEGSRDFVDNREPAIWLDFNVDGNIWELI